MLAIANTNIGHNLAGGGGGSHVIKPIKDGDIMHITSSTVKVNNLIIHLVEITCSLIVMVALKIVFFLYLLKKLMRN